MDELANLEQGNNLVKCELKHKKIEYAWVYHLQDCTIVNNVMLLRNILIK